MGLTEDRALSQIRRVVRKAVDNPEAVVELDTTANDVDGWDSLAHAHIILSVEQRLGVKLPGEKLFDLTNVGDLVQLVLEVKFRESAADDERD